MRQVERTRTFGVRYCEKCELSFETNSYGGRMFIAYYEHMPTFKLERKSCPKHDSSDTKQYYEEKL